MKKRRYKSSNKPMLGTCRYDDPSCSGAQSIGAKCANCEDDVQDGTNRASDLRPEQELNFDHR